MKGFLSLTLLWLIAQHPSTGTQLMAEVEIRRKQKPSPGTIYPALKELRVKKLITLDQHKTYSLTKKGYQELYLLLEAFFCTFHDIDMMRSVLNKQRPTYAKKIAHVRAR
jgi:DNA-binding PadR family transcriptional regulator